MTQTVRPSPFFLSSCLFSSHFSSAQYQHSLNYPFPTRSQMTLHLRSGRSYPEREQDCFRSDRIFLDDFKTITKNAAACPKAPRSPKNAPPPSNNSWLRSQPMGRPLETWRNLSLRHKQAPVGQVPVS